MIIKLYGIMAVDSTLLLNFKFFWQRLQFSLLSKILNFYCTLRMQRLMSIFRAAPFIKKHLNFHLIIKKSGQNRCLPYFEKGQHIEKTFQTNLKIGLLCLKKGFINILKSILYLAKQRTDRLL